MLNRQSDINELLAESFELLQQIEEGYAGAKNNEEIIQIAKPKVKSCLEHLRSCLDYIATDLSGITNSSKTPRDIHFPYGKDRKIFIKSLNRNLPDLSSNYQEIIENIQPHTSGDKWLLHLCKTVNFNKHTELQQQDRVNSDKSTTTVGNLVRMEGGGNLTIGNIYINGEHKNPKGPLVVTKDKPIKDIVDETGLDIPIERKYEWVRFVLKGTALDVRELLSVSHSKITNLVSEIYSA
ncbi:hypothetical protein I6F54_00650 [Pseudoalteromonas sp. SWXJZ10B]|nr:hypothetical protein [Pseudoalteromonas sp. SWXJZ10B]